MAKRRKENKNNLTSKYRFAIFNDTTHEEIFKFRGNGLLSILAIILSVICIIIGVTYLIAYTSLREFIPGYPSPEMRRSIIQNAIKIDSIQREVNIWRLQLANIQKVAKGEAPIALDSILSLSNYKDSLTNGENFINGDILIKDDSLLRAIVLKEEQFNISSRTHKIEQIEGLHFYPPLKGVVTQEYNLGTKHPFIDIAAAENSIIAATLNGTIISAGWNDNYGYSIIIQHDNNLLSIYKHNSRLLIKEGDKVSAGTPIAIIGDSGRLSYGVHLHFELWHKGEPINPAEYINF